MFEVLPGTGHRDSSLQVVTGRILLPFLGLLETLIFGLGCGPALPPLPPLQCTSQMVLGESGELSGPCILSLQDGDGRLLS